MKKGRTNRHSRQEAGTGWTGLVGGESTALWRLSVYYVDLNRKGSYCMQLTEEVALMQTDKYAR